MLNPLLPRQADNNYQGYKLALWIFAVVLLMFAAMSVNSIFNGYYVATSADGLPLGSYSPAGAQAVVSFYAVWGVTQLAVVALGVIALVRYRTLVPLMLLLLLLERLFLKVVDHYVPIAGVQDQHAVSIFIAVLYLLMAGGLFLSLWRRHVPAS